MHYMVMNPRIYETTVKSFVANDNGEVCAAELVKLSWQKDPESGRMVMHEIEGSNEIIPVDLVLIAAGFLGSQSYVTDAFGVEWTAEPMSKQNRAIIIQAKRKSMWPEICIEDSHWLYGRSEKVERLQNVWTLI